MCHILVQRAAQLVQRVLVDDVSREHAALDNCCDLLFRGHGSCRRMGRRTLSGSHPTAHGDQFHRLHDRHLHGRRLIRCLVNSHCRAEGSDLVLLRVFCQLTSLGYLFCRARAVPCCSHARRLVHNGVGTMGLGLLWNNLGQRRDLWLLARASERQVSVVLASQSTQGWWTQQDNTVNHTAVTAGIHYCTRSPTFDWVIVKCIP